MNSSESATPTVAGHLRAWYAPLVLAAAIFYLSVTALDGALRYLLSVWGFIYPIYLPKLLMALVLALAPFAAPAATRRLAWWIMAAVACFASVGLVFTRNPVQVAFGGWVLLPVLFAAVAYPALAADWRRWWTYALALWAVCLVGLLLDLFIDYPWGNYTYRVAGFRVLAAKVVDQSYEWLRLAGFTRILFDAAYQLLLLGLFLVITGQRRSLALVVWLLTGVGLILTTNKGAVVVFVLLSALWLLRGRVGAQFWKSLALAAVLLGILLPVSTLVVDYDYHFRQPAAAFLGRSMMTRLQRIWPQSMEFVQERGTVVAGRGIGGFGVATKRFERAHYAPGDSFYVYVMGTGGLALIVLLVGLLGWAFWRAEPEGRRDELFYPGLFALFLSGVTSNIVEVPYQAFLLGLSIHWAYDRLRERRQAHVAAD